MTQDNPLALAPAVYDFDLNDFGEQPDYDKDFLKNKVIICFGVSQATFEGSFDKGAKSLLHRFPSDPETFGPFGCLLSEDSPAIRQALEMQNRGRVPFMARLSVKPSQTHKGQEYWTFERYTAQYDQEGNLIDPNATQKKEGK